MATLEEAVAGDPQAKAELQALLETVERSKPSPLQPSFFMPSGGAMSGVQHTLILGTTGRGKSLLLQQEAERLGITVEELENRLEPSAEQKAAEQQREASERDRRFRQLQAVRDAWWQGSNESDVVELRWAVQEHLGIEASSVDVLKAAFDQLPADLMGDIIRWGMSDTEVRESIWDFVRDNQAPIRGELDARGL